MTSIRKILDRLTPVRLQVYYGPNRSIDHHRELGAYGWGCNRRRCVMADVGGYTRSLAFARESARWHARSHFGMRAVYGEG